MEGIAQFVKRFDKINSPKFSIILPVYDVEPFLIQCLNSIVNQSLPDFEVICINDGSKDNSLKILNQYADKDKRFIIISQENQGQGVARNKGLEIATGEYVIFVDPDDWIELDALEQIYKTFNVTKAEVIEFNYREYNDYSGKTKNHNHAKIIRKNFNYDLSLVPYYNWQNVKKGCLSKLDMHVWSRAYSLSFIKRANAVFSPTKHGEDHLFACVVVLNAKKIQYLDKYLYTYRCRNGSAVNSISNNNFGIFQNCELLKDYLIKHNFFDELKEEFQKYQITVLGWHYHNLPEESVEKYEAMCKKMLSPKDYKQMIYKSRRKNTFLESFFSLKNERKLGIKYKVITILGIKIKLKPKKKSEVLYD